MDVDETILRRDSETVEAEIPWRIFGFGFLALGGRRRGVIIIIIIIISTRPCRPKREGHPATGGAEEGQEVSGSMDTLYFAPAGENAMCSGGKSRRPGGNKNDQRSEEHWEKGVTYCRYVEVVSNYDVDIML